MKVFIELYSGSEHNYHVTKKDIQKNIDSLYRFKNGKKLTIDDILMIDTISILEEIKLKLPID